MFHSGKRLLTTSDSESVCKIPSNGSIVETKIVENLNLLLFVVGETLHISRRKILTKKETFSNQKMDSQFSNDSAMDVASSSPSSQSSTPNSRQSDEAEKKNG